MDNSQYRLHYNCNIDTNLFVRVGKPYNNTTAISDDSDVNIIPLDFE